MPDLPARFAGVILAFAPLFVHRSWRHARVLLIGAILAPGRRTVTSILRIMGLSRERHFVNFHRVLSRSAWSPRRGAQILLRLLIDAFATRGAVVMALDDMIERRWGRRIRARHRPRSSPLLGRSLRRGDPSTPWQVLVVAGWNGAGERRIEDRLGHRGVAALGSTCRADPLDADPRPREPLPAQALLCSDLARDPAQIIAWFARRWSVEVTFQEVGVETQRQWSDTAIASTTPCLLALFSIVTLLAARLPFHERS